jgi:hypothetical protein
MAVKKPLQDRREGQSMNPAPSMLHLPKPPSQFKNLFWNFRVVNLVVFPR